MQVTIVGDNGNGLAHAAKCLGRALGARYPSVVSWRDYPARIQGGRAAHTVRGCAAGYGLADADDIVIDVRADQLEYELPEARTLIVRVLPDGTLETDCPGAYEVSVSTARKGAAANIGSRALFGAGVASCLLVHDSSEAVADQYPADFAAGWSYAQDTLLVLHRKERPTGADWRSVVYPSGNEVVAAAALCAKCRFVAAYPITPATEIFECLQERLPQVGGNAVLAEDEIAAASMAIGASFAGVRSLTTTSGPGMSLMTEALGFAAMIEVPLVVIHCSRGGPSTGMPTRHEQSDVHHLLFGGHGEFARAVLAPANGRQLFEDVIRAFDLADAYQCPVIVLLDQMLAVDRSSLSLEDLPGVDVSRGGLVLTGHVDATYRRYRDGKDGTSLRTVPGVEGGAYMASGSEHDEFGRPDDRAGNRRRMTDRRLQKVAALGEELRDGVVVVGPDHARVALVVFGSTLGPSLEAAETLAAGGTSCKIVQLRVLWPLPEDAIRGALSSASHVFVVEQNATGQVHALVRSFAPNSLVVGIRRSDGRPFRPRDIVSPVSETVAR